MNKIAGAAILSFAILLPVACGKPFSVTTSPAPNPPAATMTPTTQPIITATPSNTPTKTYTAVLSSATPTITGTPTPTVPPGSTATFTPSPTPPYVYLTTTPVPCLHYTTLKAPFESRTHCPPMSIFKNKMWVLPGFYNQTDVWSSNDGASWTKEASNTNLGTPFEYTTAEFNNQLWLAGGNLNVSTIAPPDVWSSPDGVNWNKTATINAIPGKANATLVPYNGRLYFIAGDTYVIQTLGTFCVQTNDVWSSADGANWTQETPQAAFGPRRWNGSLVFNNKMWVVAGCSIQSCVYLNTTQFYNDAWYSTDGANWTAATTQAPFSPRAEALVTVLNGQMWVIGGSDANNNPLNDAWYTNDGVNWTPAATACPGAYTSTVHWGFQNLVWGFENALNGSATGWDLRIFHN